MVSSAKTGRPTKKRLRIANEKQSSRNQLIAFSLMPYPVSDSVLFWIERVHRAKVESIERLCERLGCDGRERLARRPARLISASSIFLRFSSGSFIIAPIDLINLRLRCATRPQAHQDISEGIDLRSKLTRLTTLAFALLLVGLSAASAGTAGGSAALALAGVVATYSPLLSSGEKKAVA